MGVRLVSPEGVPADVDPAEASYYLDRGFRPESGGDIVGQADRAVVSERQANRGIADQVGAGVLGLARGATFGASDVLAEGLGVDRRTRADLKQDFAKTSAVSEIVGAVAPALIPGGQGSLLRALPAGRAALVGERIAQAGEGASALGKIGALAKAGAAEGAIQTGGQYLSQVALGDRELSAEAFLADTGKGALLGGAIGGGLGAAERGFIAARKLLPKSAGSPQAVRAAADDVDAQLTKALDGTERAKQAARDKLEALRLQRADLDVAAQAKVAERRALEAAQAEQRLATQRELDAIRLDRAKNPKPRGRRSPDAPDGIGAPATDAQPVEVVNAPDPITSSPPADDLEALLSQTKARMDAGESFGALGASAKRPAIEPIHEAMAEIDPEAAALVNAVKAHDAAADAVKAKFTIRDRFGTHKVSIPEMADMTLGRVKQAYEAADDAERVAILETIGPDRAKALTDVVEGRATFDKWYKNKNHWYEDPTYQSAMEPVGPAPDDLPDHFGEGTSPDLFGNVPSPSDAEALHSMNRAVDDLREYEQTMTHLVDALGPAAPPDLIESAAQHVAAVDNHAAATVDSLAHAVDNLPVGTAANDVADPLKAASLVGLPGAEAARPAAGKLGGLLADLGAANEALQTFGINTPFSVRDIPFVGPLASGYLKLRAALTVAKKAGLKVPFAGDAVVAAGAARSRDQVSAAVDSMLTRGERAAAKVNTSAGRIAAVNALPRAASALRERLYNDGTRQPTPKNDVEALRQRLAELQSAEENPAALRSTVRKALGNVRDAAVVSAVTAAAERKLAYLRKHAPQPPVAAPLSRAQWAPPPADVARFARRVQAANDPIGVLRDVARGAVTAEAVDTLREVYPRLYEEARSQLLERAPMIRERLPASTAVRMSVLFDVPLLSSLEPDNFAAIQGATFAPSMLASGPQPASAGQAMSPPPGGAPQVSDLVMTAEQRRAR